MAKLNCESCPNMTRTLIEYGWNRIAMEWQLETKIKIYDIPIRDTFRNSTCTQHVAIFSRGDEWVALGPTLGV